MPTPKQNIQLVTKRRQLQSKTFNQEHKDANSKTKHSIRDIKMPTPKQNIRFGVGVFMFLVKGLFWSWRLYVLS
jgi:hypothetical protein